MPVALRGEEGRDKLRKATGIGTHELIRRYPNGATQYHEVVLPYGGQTGGTETSKYPQEKKIIMIAQVVASERAGAQTSLVTARLGL